MTALITSPKRKTVKAGKRERIRKMLAKLHLEQARPVVDGQLMMLLGMKKEKR